VRCFPPYFTCLFQSLLWKSLPSKSVFPSPFGELEDVIHECPLLMSGPHLFKGTPSLSPPRSDPPPLLSRPLQCVDTGVDLLLGFFALGVFLLLRLPFSHAALFPSFLMYRSQSLRRSAKQVSHRARCPRCRFSN